MKGDRLTLKQEKFVLEYIASGNATDAALKAGYSKKTARRQEQKPVKACHPRAHRRAPEEARRRKIADKKEVLQLLTQAARGEMTEDVPDITPEGKLMIVTKTVMGREKIKALELLGKHHQLFTENINVTNAPKVVIHVRNRDKH